MIIIIYYIKFFLKKSSYKKPIANTKLNGEKLNAFPQDVEQGKNVYCHHFNCAVNVPLRATGNKKK